MDDTTTEQELTGGTVNDVVRRGDTVRRSAGPWTPTVQALLAWVRAQGVSFVPAPLGLDEQGREVLGWIPGETGGWPVPDWVWTPAAREQAAEMLRRVHDASVGFAPRGGVALAGARAGGGRVPQRRRALQHGARRRTGRRVHRRRHGGARAACVGPRLPGLPDVRLVRGHAGPCGRAARGAAGSSAGGLRAGRGAGAAVVLRTMRERLLDLAGWTEEGPDDRPRRPAGHAALYRRDVERLPRGDEWLPVPHQQGAEMRHRLLLTLDANWTSVQ